MSTHQNQPKTSGPTSNRTKIRGAGATYRASVQEQSKGASSTKPAGSGKIEKIQGQGSAPQGEDVKDMPEGFGSGHYKPNKG